MDRTALASSLLGALLLAVSCSQVRPLQSIVNESYIASPQDYVVLEETEGRATAARLLGFIPMGMNAGYLEAYQDALANSGSPNANGLIEVFSDCKITCVPFWFLPLYMSETTIVYGRAVQRVDQGKELSSQPVK